MKCKKMLTLTVVVLTVFAFMSVAFASSDELSKVFGNKGIDLLPSIAMFTADKKILIGWLASQTDMLAEDWVVLDDQSN